MSKEPEESVDSKEVHAPEDSEVVSEAIPESEAEPENTSESNESDVSTEEAAQPDAAEIDSSEVPAEETENADAPSVETTNDKIKAIKTALWTQEDERLQEETKLQIADKVKKYKECKESGEPLPESEGSEQAPTESADADTAADVSKKRKKKKSKRKKSGKKRRASLFPQRGDGFLEAMRKCIFLASSAIFVVCLALIADYFWDNYQNAQLMGDLEDIYYTSEDVQEPTEAVTEDIEDPYEYFGLLPNAENLLALNPDVVGWISIPGTDINYPVLQRKGQADGNDYYLKRNIYLEEAHAGSIFMDYRNDFDYVIDGRKQVENSGNLVIYGHNMHDYSMFGSLKHYMNNVNYYGEHPIVELNSNYRKYKYKIFGFIVVDIDDDTETRFDYWNVLDFADERAFYDYVNEVKRRTVRLNDVDVRYGDELLTLSTCNSTFSNGRFVVFARKVRDGEDLYAGTETSIANPNIKWPNSYYRWRKNTYDPDAEFVPYG